MNSNVLKLLSSIPIILLFLYLVPFVGICLIILRLFVRNKDKSIIKYLILLGLLIFIPKLVGEIVSLLKIKLSYINTIIKSDIYIKLLSYAETLLIVGIILLLISVIFKKAYEKIWDMIKKYITSYEKTQREISKENDMKIKIKQEKAKNTNVIHCPYCGADNIITDKVGECKYCRRQLENE